MAYQNFFASTDNYRRKTPAQASGKGLTNEFRMRKDGDSMQVVQIIGTDNNDGTITTRVMVFDPNTGETVFNQSFTCDK